MILRPYASGDLEELKEILAKSGFRYIFPQLEDWRFNPKLILEDDAGRIAMGAGLRMTSEAYLWVNNGIGTPRERWEWLRGLHEAVRQEAARIGYTDVHAFLPPEIAKRFGPRLESLGWRPEEFVPWWRETA